MTVAAPIRSRQQQPPITRDHRTTLPANPRAVAEARRQVRAAVRYWRLPVDIDAAAVCTSELVTNAITHDTVLPGPPGAPEPAASPEGARPADPEAANNVVLSIIAADGRLRVDVYDSCSLPPVPQDRVSPYAESGRGLNLVDSLASGWGCYPTATGKAVYFTLDFTQPGKHGGVGLARGCAGGEAMGRSG